MKRIIAMTLAMLLIFSCIPVFASAEEITGSEPALASVVTYETTFEPPQKTTYLVGDKLDLTGAKVVYSGSDGDNYSVDLTNALATGFDNTKTGEQKITLTYTDPRQGITSTVSYIVTVVEKSVLVSIHPTKSPDKQLYTQGEDLDVTGGEITLVYNTHTETIPMTLDMVSGYDKTIVGPQKLTITYQGCTTDFVVTVKAPLRPKRIDFVEGKAPKDSYMVGETLDLSAIVLDVHYSDGTSKQVAANDPAVTVTGFDSSKPARLDIKFEYGGSNRICQSIISLKEGKCGDDLTFAFDDATGTLTIEGSGAMYDYDYNNIAPWTGYAPQIKKTILPTGITTIGSFAFSNCSDMETINLPGTLTELKEFAFCNCFNLDLPKDILPASVKTIGQYAFSDCYGITEFDIPQGVTIIDDYAFGYCTNLTKINLPSSVKVIGNGAFIACPKLKAIDFPEGLQAIRSVAFQSSGLEEFTIPGTVTEIAYMAFFDTQNLKEVTFEGDAPTLQTMGDLWADPFSGWEYPSTKAVNAYYPGGNDTWTDEVRSQYGDSKDFTPANITWIPSYGVVDKDTGMDPEVDGLDKVLEDVLKDLPEQDLSKKNTVALVISNVEIDTDDPETKEAIEKIEAVGKEKNIDFMDITLSHLADGEVVVHEGNTNLGSKNNHLLVITLSYDSLGKKNMVVFRYHNGKVDTLTQNPNSDGEFIEIKNGTLVIHAKKFSTYAVGYDPVPVVTFQTNGGGTIPPQEADASGKVTKPTDPEKENYRFLGWFRDEACTEAWNFETDTATGSMTLYAGWAKLVLSAVAISPREAELVQGQAKAFTADVTIDEGNEAALTWSITGKKASGTAISDKGVLTLAGDESAKTITVTVTAKCGQETKTDSATVTVRPSCTVKDESDNLYAPTAEGLDDVLDDVLDELREDEGYNPAKSYEVQLVVAPGDEDTPQSEAISAKAEADQRAHVAHLEISLNLLTNGEAEALTSIKDLVSVSLKFDPLGKRDVQVYRYHDGKVDILTTAKNTDGEYIQIDSANKKLIIHTKKFSAYAIAYNSIPVVTFNSNQGSSVPSQEVAVGGTVTKPNPNPTRSGYRFTGWYTGSDLKTLWNFETGTVSDDMTLYAGWTKLVLTGLTISPDKADVIQSESQTFTAKVTIDEGCDYTLTWSITAEETMDKDTKITDMGSGKAVLTLGDDEPAGNKITVTVTAKSGSETLTDTAAVTVIPDYDITSGSGKRWSKNSTSSLTFVANGPYSKLDKVLIDNKSIGKDAASKHSTGTKVILKSSYLKGLSVGEHTITICYTDGGEAEGYFRVQSASDSANTGDAFNPALWLSLMGVCAAGIVVLLLILKKRR